jgi:putative DNA primase/helicase
VPIPEGVTVIDLDAYKGATREAVEQLLGCALPWDAALVQFTPGNKDGRGEHYAFQAPDWSVKQDSNHKGLEGFDTRSAGKGYICTGSAYPQKNGGVFRLMNPVGLLPKLPDACRSVLEAVTVTADPVDLPVGDRNVDDVRQALTFISSDCTRGEWINMGMSLRHHFHDTPDVGYALWVEWSESAPGLLDYTTVEQQWNSLKAEPGTGATRTIASVFGEAMTKGYKLPSGFDTAAAFGPQAAPGDVYVGLITRINESGSDPEQIPAVIDEIRSSRCNALQNALLCDQLLSGMKGAEFKSKGLLDMVRNALTPASAKPEGQPAVFSEELMAVADIPMKALSRPTTSHGGNARLMLNEVFTPSRLKGFRGDLRWWNGQHWEELDPEWFETATLQALEPLKATVGNIAGTQKTLYMAADKLTLPPLDKRVYFLNGVLDLNGGPHLVAHNKENLNLDTLQVEYSPASKCPQWDAFLESIFNDVERRELLQEIFGYCLFTDLLNLHKVIALEGASRAGKGVALEVLTEILGPHACGDFTFSNLADGKTQSSFRHSRIMLDLEAKPPSRQDATQALAFLNKASSNERVSIQLLHTQKTWGGRLDAKVLMACNSIPTMRDSSGASANRFMILKFTREFTEEQQDRGLLQKLLAEVAGITAWAVEGARRLLVNSGRFTFPPTSAEAIEELKTANRPMLGFLEEYFVVDPKGKCRSIDVLAAYQKWCRENNVRQKTKSDFIIDFKKLFPSIDGAEVKVAKSVRVDGHPTTSGYKGIRLIPDVETVPSATQGAFQPHLTAVTK